MLSAACVACSGSDHSGPSPHDAAQQLATAWSKGHPEQGPLVDAQGVAAAYLTATRGLHAGPPAVSVTSVDPAPSPSTQASASASSPVADSMTARLHVTWKLVTGATFAYDTSVGLRQQK